MGIFVPKHEMVEAYQFTGGEENALEIQQLLDIREVQMVHAGWAEDPEEADPKKERLLIETTKFEYAPAYIGDWIIIHQDDRVDILKPSVMRARYVKMGVNGEYF